MADRNITNAAITQITGAISKTGLLYIYTDSDQKVAAADLMSQHPSYTTTERNALTAVVGQVIWNSTDSQLQMYNGSAWVEVGSAAPVDSVFGRTGAVVAVAGDYSASEVTNDSAVSGANVDDALNTLNTSKANTSHSHAAADITSGTFANARIAASNVTQHQAALTITESQISDLDHSAVKIRGVAIDATVGTPSDGDILVYRSAGSDWVLESKPAGGSNPALNDVTDVVITSVADNEVLAYNNATSQWINQTAAEAGLYGVGGTDVAVADGGTGSSTASGARTNLGLAIGADVQAFSANLTALEAVATSGHLVRTGAGTYAARTITGTANLITVTNGDGVAGAPTITVGTNVVRKDQSNIYTTGAKQTWGQSGGAAAFNFGGITTADPSTLADGDVWFRSGLNKIFYRSSGVTRELVTAALTQTLTNKTIDATANTISNIGNAQVVASIITGQTAEAAPVSGDFILGYDTSAGALRKFDIGNLPSGGGGISNVVEDLTPQLGGDLDLNGSKITQSGVSIFESATNAVQIVAVTEAQLWVNGTKRAYADSNGFNVTGNIAVTGTVDGRDVATDGTKLDGIAAGAEVNPDVVSQAEAEAGTATTERIWTAQRVKQAIDALGGATAFTPLSLPGLVAWYDADAITGLSDTDPVTTWNDLSGNGWNLGQSTAAAKPLYRTGILNSKPVLRFDGTDDFMVNSDFNLGGQMTIIVVYANRTGGNGSLFSNDVANGPLQRETSTFYHGSQPAITTTSLNLSNLYVALFDWDRRSHQVRLDGAVAGSALGTGDATGTTFKIGARSTGIEFLNGDIAEVIVCATLLGGNDLANVESYLTTKWGL